MTNQQRARRRVLIARRARFLDAAATDDLEHLEAVRDLYTTQRKALESAGALWVARARGQLDRSRVPQKR